MPWIEARNKAKTLGGELVTINDHSESEWIMYNLIPKLQALPNSGANQVWIGLYKPNNRWIWSSNQNTEYQNWGKNQPSGDGNYGTLKLDYFNHATYPGVPGDWNDLPGGRELLSIVEIASNSTGSTTPTPRQIQSHYPENKVLFVNVDGVYYNSIAEQIYNSLLAENISVTYVNLESEGKVHDALLNKNYDQIWVIDLDLYGKKDDYREDWLAISQWYHQRNTGNEIICDARIISSFRDDPEKTEGPLLAKNYYHVLSAYGGGLVLATDSTNYQIGINTLNEQIGLNLFKGKFEKAKKLRITKNHPIFNNPNKVAEDLFNESSPGEVPYGTQPNGMYLLPIGWHSHEKINPGISTSIPNAPLPSIPTETITPSPTPTTSPTNPTQTPTPPMGDDFAIGGTELSARPGTTIDVPIEITQLPETTAITFNLEYDTNLLSWNQEIKTDNTLIANWGLKDANKIEEGKLVVSGIAVSSEPIHGSGVLINLPFNVSSNITSTTSTTITLSNLKDGLSGATVKDITMVIPIGKKGDVNEDGDITASDAQMAFEIALGRISPTSEQTCAAEVTGDDDITAADVQLIFEVALSKSTFSDTSAKTVYQRPVLHPYQTTSISVDNIEASGSSDVMVPVRINPGSDITSLTMDIVYDSSKLTFNGIDKTGTLIESFLLADANEVSTGTVRLAAAAVTADPITSQGILVNLLFSVNSQASGTTSIDLQSLKDDIAGADVTNGSVIQTHSTLIKDFYFYGTHEIK